MSAKAGRSIAIVLLALANAVGFSSSTAVPFWLGGIGERLGLPIWSGAVIASLQLASSAIFNLATPWLFKAVPLRRLAALAATVGVAGNLLATVPNPACFIVGCCIAGAALGVLLNTTNQMASQTASVEGSYAVFELVGVILSMSLFLVLPVLALKLGFAMIFVTLAVLCAAASLYFWTLDPKAAFLVRSEAAASLQLDGLKTGRLITKLMGLVGMFVLFVGQSAINAYLVPLGRGLAINMDVVGRLMAGGLAASLVGGVLARVLAGRLGILAPIVGGALALTLDAVMLTTTTVIPVYMAFVMFYFICIVFMTPYTYSLLARIDTTGKTASIGPAFLMSGIAVGPSVGAFASGVGGTIAIGWAAGGAVILSALLFVTAYARREQPSPIIGAARHGPRQAGDGLHDAG
jgi:predicted MFS family arabinose efflux permease